MVSNTFTAASRVVSLQEQEVETLVLRWQREQDRAARDELVRRFTPLTRSLARRYAQSSTPVEDIMQVAALGLLKAIDRFDPQHGRPLQAYATPTILGEIRRYFRDCTWGVHVPRGAQERSLAVRDATEVLTNEQGHAPTVNQLAEYLETGIEEVLDGLHALSAYDAVPLDAPRGEGGETTLTETLGSEESGFDFVEDWAVVEPLLRELPELDRTILRLRFVEEMTQSQIAKRVGCSQMQVSRLLRRSLEQMRAAIEAL